MNVILNVSYIIKYHVIQLGAANWLNKLKLKLQLKLKTLNLVNEETDFDNHIMIKIYVPGKAPYVLYVSSRM